MINLPLYKLVGHLAVPCESLEEWSDWFERADRRVGETWLDDVRISTVFLGLCSLGEREPLLFETAVFVSDSVHRMGRYSVWEEAEAGHADMMNLIQAEMNSARKTAVEAWETLLRRELHQG